MPIGAPATNNVGYPWFIEENTGKKICLCMDCGISLSRDEKSNVVGFLTEREHLNYKKDAEYCRRLHTDGYVILKEKHWKPKWLLGKMGLNELKECFLKKQPIVGNLKDHRAKVNGEKSSGSRRWASWDGKAKFVEDVISGNSPSHTNPPLIDNSIIHADVHWARIARLNYLKKSHAEYQQIGHEQTIELVDFACLWRAEHVEEVQRVHADTDAGHYHLVMPLSSEDYEIETYQYTHLTTMRSNQDDNIVTPSQKRVLHLKMGQILVFCSNLAHCGGRSRYASENMKGIKEFITCVDWFTGKNNSEKQIADLSIHAGLQSKLFPQNIRSNYETGLPQFIRVQYLNEMDITAKEKSEIIYKQQERRTKAIIDLSLRLRDTKEKDSCATAVSPCCLLLFSHLDIALCV